MLKASEIELKDNYYWAKWRIRKKELFNPFFFWTIFHIWCYIAGQRYRTSDIALIVPIVCFSDIIMIFLLYLGIKVPCIRWKKGEKTKGAYRDITVQQNKYRGIIMCIYYGILLAAWLLTVYVIMFVKIKE